jgi:hypothetical protein
MKHDTHPWAGGQPPAGRYDGSRLLFRGPARELDGRHVAVVGGGQGPEDGGAPYPAWLEAELGVPCADLGVLNASVEAFLGDPVVPEACRAAQATVVEAMGAANLSNRLYSVHPRRNDRFLRPSGALRALYPEVDFAEICFTRHLLLRLRDANAERFDLVVEELRIAWAARMRAFLERIGPRTLLLWAPGGEGPLGPEPLFVTPAMVEALRPLVAGIVVVPETDAAAHREVAAALAGPVRALLGEGRLRASA